MFRSSLPPFIPLVNAIMNPYWQPQHQISPLSFQLQQQQQQHHQQLSNLQTQCRNQLSIIETLYKKLLTDTQTQHKQQLEQLEHERQAVNLKHQQERQHDIQHKQRLERLLDQHRLNQHKHPQCVRIDERTNTKTVATVMDMETGTTYIEGKICKKCKKPKPITEFRYVGYYAGKKTETTVTCKRCLKIHVNHTHISSLLKQNNL